MSDVNLSRLVHSVIVVFFLFFNKTLIFPLVISFRYVKVYGTWLFTVFFFFKQLNSRTLNVYIRCCVIPV